MRINKIEGSTKNSLVVRGPLIDRDNWKCGKDGNYKKDYKSRVMEVSTRSDEKQSTERTMTLDKESDMYLASTSTHLDQGVWLIDSGESYHLKPHREWFYEYEQYEGGDVFVGDNWTTKIVGKGRVRLILQDRRSRTLPSVPHIPSLETKPDICQQD